LEQIAGWSAVINGVAFITSTVALLIFFSVGGIWGRVNDGLSVIWALTFIPIALFLYQLNRLDAPEVSLAALVIGIAAMIVFANLQTLLIAGILKYQQTTTPVLASAAVIGIWLIINGVLGISAQTLPAGLVLVGFVFGLSLILGSLAFWFAGERHILSAVAFLAATFSGTGWSIWLGILLLSGNLAIN
jgi:hypothetical protein